MQLLHTLGSVCSAYPQQVIFVEADDDRIIKAARFLKDENLARPILMGGNYEIRDLGAHSNIPTRGLHIVNPNHTTNIQSLSANYLSEKRSFTKKEAETDLKIPIIQAIHWLKYGKADVCIAGNKSTMQKTAQAVLKYSGFSSKVSRLSSFYLMLNEKRNLVYAFADCSINIDPKPEQLAEIAQNTALSFQQISGQRPRIAFLSFSTKGSAEHAKVEKVREAVKFLQHKSTQFAFDGELQLDAAIDEMVSRKKAANGSLNGKANVFIFPSLDAANIAQKIAEQIGGFIAIGPMLQGIKYPVHHLAQSCSVENIINSVMLASYMKIKNIQ